MRHKELRRPPVKEVIFEIRFNLDEDIEYQTIFLQLFTDLRDTYSIVIKTDQAKSLPENLPLKGLIRDKFISVDGRELLSLGKDIVVIQSLNHKTFSEFKTKLAAVVNVLKTIKPPMRVERVGLRYINEFDTKDEIIPSILAKNVSFSLESFHEIGTNSTFHLQKGQNQLNLKVLQKPHDMKLYLDLDIFSHGITALGDICPWAEAAHNDLHAAFVAALNPTYFAKIK